MLLFIYLSDRLLKKISSHNSILLIPSKPVMMKDPGSFFFQPSLQIFSLSLIEYQFHTTKWWSLLCHEHTILNLNTAPNNELSGRIWEKEFGARTLFRRDISFDDYSVAFSVFQIFDSQKMDHNNGVPWMRKLLVALPNPTFVTSSSSLTPSSSIAQNIKPMFKAFILNFLPPLHKLCSSRLIWRAVLPS